jgi:hydroxyacylglutathione hydrolase
VPTLIIPCLSDNFSFLVGKSVADGSDVAVVDPCDPAPILAEIRRRGLRLVAILNTHQHADHVGGNRALLEEFPGIGVYAHYSDRGRIPGQTHFVHEGDELHAAGLTFRVLFVPGHTSGHIAYVTAGSVFAGDTLFGGGCGRLFEGTPEAMNQSLNEKLARLPDDTLVYFAHEYTQNNLRFALSVEPENSALQARAAKVKAQRANGEWTVPTTIGEERRTNPFLRVQEPAIVARFRDALGGEPTPDAMFAALRSAKDTFS